MKRSSLARRTALAAACFGAAAAASAAPAVAATPATQLAGTNIFASGSSLQAVAQSGAPTTQNFAGLTSLFHTTASAMKWTFSGTTYQLNNDPTITYGSTSSGSGLAVFGDATSGSFLAGSLNPGADTKQSGTAVLDGFIGTDDPPTTGNLASANTASGGVSEVTVPVMQAPVALALSLPSGLTLGNKGKVNLNTALIKEIYSYNVPAATVTATIKATKTAAGCTATEISYPANTWGAILIAAGLKPEAAGATLTPTEFSDSGATIDTTPTCATQGSTTGTTGGYSQYYLQVRNGGSGTTYALQGFLGEAGLGNFSAADAEAWPTTGTQENYVDGTSAHNLGSLGTAAPTEPAGANSGSSALLKNTLAIPGSIGYVNLADAALDAGSYSSATGAVNYFTDLAQTSTYDSSASHQFLFAGVQSDYGDPSNSKATYAEPGVVNLSNAANGIVTATANVYTGSTINTSGSTYSLTQGTSVGVGQWNVPTSGGVFNPIGSWGGSLAGDPDMLYDGGGNHYPIVAATYDVAWEHYNADNLATAYTNPVAVGNTVKAYLQYLAKASGGQGRIVAGKIGYAKLPVAIDNDANAAWEDIQP